MAEVAGWQPHRETFRDAVEQWLPGAGAADEQRVPADLVRRERDFAAAVLDTAGALVVVLDREGRIVLLNCYAQQVTGYSTHEVRGRPFLYPRKETGYWPGLTTQ